MLTTYHSPVKTSNIKSKSLKSPALKHSNYLSTINPDENEFSIGSNPILASSSNQDNSFPIKKTSESVSVAKATYHCWRRFTLLRRSSRNMIHQLMKQSFHEWNQSLLNRRKGIWRCQIRADVYYKFKRSSNVWATWTKHLNLIKLKRAKELQIQKFGK